MEYISSVISSNINVIHYDGGFFEPEVGKKWLCDTCITKESKLYYITHGNCSITVDDTEYIAAAGDLFFIPAGVRHSHLNYPDKPFKKYWIEFGVTPDNVIFSRFDMKRTVKIGPRSREHALFKRYAQISTSESFPDRLEIKSIILSLVSYFIRASGTSAELMLPGESFLFKIQAYIDANIARNITTRGLAELLHIHPTHLIRIFKSETGQTPKEFITTSKIRTAKKLITTTEQSISEIAERVGYFDMAAFSKAFKKHTGYTPNQYRKKYQPHTVE